MRARVCVRVLGVKQYIEILLYCNIYYCNTIQYVTQFAKTRNNPAFLKTQSFASWCSAYLKPSSVAVSSL